jgi:hypothetical protein
MQQNEPKHGKRFNRNGPLESLDPAIISREFDERRIQMEIDSRSVGMTDAEAEAFEADLIVKERLLRERLLPSGFPTATDKEWRAELQRKAEEPWEITKGVLSFLFLGVLVASAVFSCSR